MTGVMNPERKKHTVPEEDNMSSVVVSQTEILSTAIADAKQTVLAEPPVPAQISEQVETKDGARAIEVAALFDDAVLEVRHLDNPSAGRLSGMTKGLLGSAGAALLGTFALFADSYSQVAAEKAAQEAGTATISAARPHQNRSSGSTRDAAAGGLLFYGIGALLYGLHRASSERRENEFSIGSSPQATFKVDSERLPSQLFPLVRSTGTEYELLFTDAMSGEMTLNGKTTQLAELRTQARPAAGIEGAMAMAIPDGAKLSLEHESCSFLVRSVPRPRRYPVPLRVDWGTQSYTGAVLAGAAAVMAVMFAVPPDPRSLALDAFSNEQLAHYLVKAPEVKDEQTPWLQKQVQEKHESSGGKSAKDKSGKLGKQEAPKQPARYAVAGPKDNPDPKMTRKMAEDVAKNIGIVGLIHAGNIKGLGALMGSESALGNEAMNALGNMDGRTVGDAWGNNGMGYVGVGHGGDGTGDNTIGGGPWGTLGRSGGNPGYGRFTPAARLKDHRVTTPDWTLGPPEVKGSLDKELIRRVIRQHMNEVKFCYEKELTRDNSLQGRVVVKFAIGGMGNVMTSVVESSTLRAGRTDGCIAEAVRRWMFPKPQNGIVMVSYPFVLKSTTSE